MKRKEEVVGVSIEAKEMAVGEIDSEGQLELREDPEAWIKRNPASRLSSLTSLTVYYYGGEEIGESIGELIHLIRLNFFDCNSLKSVPNTLTRLRYLKHLEFDGCECLEELPANIGQLVSLTHLQLYYCNKIKYLPDSIANLPNFTSLILRSCESLVGLPANIGHLVSLTHLELLNCSNLTSLSLESDLGHLKKTLTHLSLSDCGWVELPESLCQLESLTHLYLSECNNMKSLPKSIANLFNLTCLSLSDCSNVVELPPYLDRLAHLCLLDIQECNIKCLPWSIMKLLKLRHLMLPKDFRLETLPDNLNNSVIISVDDRHVRKSWDDLKKDMPQLSVQIVGEIPNDSIENPSIIFPPGYLRLEEDPSQWIINNSNLLNLVRVLDLEHFEELTDSITQFTEITHLYLSLYYENCLMDNYFVTWTRLRHLSLEFCDIDDFVDMSIFHSLSRLSNLESLHLSFEATELPADINMPDSLNHLSLSCCEDMRPLVDSLKNLTNLKTLDLYECSNCDSLPNLNLEKLKLCKCSFKSLSIDDLRHLEIFFNIKVHDYWGFLNQLVNLETLSITCYHMKFLPEEIAGLRNLQKLQLKDCFNLRELPSNLHELVNLRTLDISITIIKSLPLSFMKSCNLQKLILPKCFHLESLPWNLKQVFITDDTEETYYERMGYNSPLFQTSADASDESEEKETERGVVPRESGNAGNDIVPTVTIDEIVPAQQTSADPFNSLSMGYLEDITSEFEMTYKDGQNEAFSKEFEKGKINAQPLPHGLHVTPIIRDFHSNRVENSNPEVQNIPAVQNDITTMETEQGNCDNEQNGKKRKEISLEMLQSCWSKNMTLDAAAEAIGVSRSTVKRRLKDLKQVWPSNRKGKQHDAKKRKLNNKSLLGSDFSQENTNSAAQTEFAGECKIGADQFTLEQNEISSKFIVKATYKEDVIRFDFSLSNSIEQLKEEVANQLELEFNTFKIKYEDEDRDLVTVNCISHLEHALNLSRSSDNTSSVVKLFIVPKT